MKVQSYDKPEVLVKITDDIYRYRWDIHKEERILDYSTDAETIVVNDVQWVANEVELLAPLSANKIIESAITKTWSNSQEQKLVNEYNAAMLGISNGEEAERAKEAYSAFLRERAELKAQVERDCEMLKIK